MAKEQGQVMRDDRIDSLTNKKIDIDWPPIQSYKLLWQGPIEAKEAVWFVEYVDEDIAMI